MNYLQQSYFEGHQYFNCLVNIQFNMMDMSMIIYIVDLFSALGVPWSLPKCCSRTFGLVFWPQSFSEGFWRQSYAVLNCEYQYCSEKKIISLHISIFVSLSLFLHSLSFSILSLSLSILSLCPPSPTHSYLILSKRSCTFKLSNIFTLYIHQ